MRSPTQRSLNHLRKRGYACQVVERWVFPPGAEHGRRFDCWGCDLLGVHTEGTKPIILVQTTSSSNHAARVTKMIERPELCYWIESGARVECHSWGTRKKDGREYWVGRVERGTLDALGQLIFMRLPDVWSSHPRTDRKAKVKERAGYMTAMYGGDDGSMA